MPGTEEVGRELPGKGQEGNLEAVGDVLNHSCDVVTGQYMSVSSLNCILKKVKWNACINCNSINLTFKSQTKAKKPSFRKDKT